MVNEPLRLNKCPIIESVFEMRFESQHDANVVFALIYGALKDDFMKVESLPVAELPPTIRDTDPNLKYQPAYKLRHKDNHSFLQIGAKMVDAQLNSTTPVRNGSVIDVDTYSVSCENFFEDITNFLDGLHSAEKHVFFRLLTDEFLDTLQPVYE